MHRYQKCRLLLTSLTSSIIISQRHSGSTQFPTPPYAALQKFKYYPQTQHTALTHNDMVSFSFYFVITDFSGCNARLQTCAKVYFYSYNGESTNIKINVVILPNTKYITSHNV